MPTGMPLKQKEEKVAVSGVYTCPDCGETARFGRDESFPLCPRCHYQGEWQLLRKVWGEL